MCNRVAFSACISSWLAADIGASRMRLNSSARGVMRVNTFKSTRGLFEPISLAIMFLHPSLVDCQPRFLHANWDLLITTHTDFSASVYWVATSICRPGVCVTRLGAASSSLSGMSFRM